MHDGSNGEFSPQDVLRAQRTEAGRRYDQLRDKLRVRMANDPKFRAERDADIRQLREMRAVSPSQVHKNAFLSNISVQYKNDDYIGEQAMPVVEVGKLSDSFPTYNKRDRLGVPDDSMGSRSDANELSESRGSDTYSLSDYALKNSLSATTEKNQDPAFDEMMDLTEALLDALALKREKRIATKVQTAGNYGGNTTTLAGATQWSDPASDPVKNLQDGLAACWNGHGPGEFIGVCSLDVANVLVRHAKILGLFQYTMPGLAKLQGLANEIGLSRIVVGAAREDTANSGQSASYGRIWGKHFSIIRVARRPTLRNASFGYTMRLKGDPVVNTWFDPSKGKDGSYFAQAGFSEDHKIVAGDTGYLYVNAVA